MLSSEPGEPEKDDCNVTDPPTGEEDATMALTIRANRPMNMDIRKMLKENALN